jgi:hypothetical protein
MIVGIREVKGLMKYLRINGTTNRDLNSLF